MQGVEELGVEEPELTGAVAAIETPRIERPVTQVQSAVASEQVMIPYLGSFLPHQQDFPGASAAGVQACQAEHHGEGQRRDREVIGTNSSHEAVLLHTGHMTPLGT